jgi:hypothetical protein
MVSHYNVHTRHAFIVVFYSKDGRESINERWDDELKYFEKKKCIY